VPQGGAQPGDQRARRQEDRVQHLQDHVLRQGPYPEVEEPGPGGAGGPSPLQ
jgi:hypothetical protein